jgi:peptidoglycan/LPS O-acetylase OafA/YrhL
VFGLWRRWPLLAVTLALLGAYLTLAELDNEREAPRTFLAGLAAMMLGAWLYAVAADHSGGRAEDGNDDPDGRDRGERGDQ